MEAGIGPSDMLELLPPPFDYRCDVEAEDKREWCPFRVVVKFDYDLKP